MVITSVNNEHIKEINKLKEKKYRDLTNSFIVEGEHLVLEAYKNKSIKELVILDGNNFNLDNVDITYVNDSVMKKLSNMDSYPNVLAVCNKTINNSISNKILILEDIQDPGNLGTIIRSAAAFGIDTIVVSPKTVDFYNHKVIRSTQGMIFNVNVIVRNLEEYIPLLKNDGYVIYGTKVDGGVDIKKVSIPSKSAFVIGNEGQGISTTISNLCDNYLYIKMDNKVESLNAGVAASIIMYEVFSKNETN